MICVGETETETEKGGLASEARFNYARNEGTKKRLVRDFSFVCCRVFSYAPQSP